MSVDLNAVFDSKNVKAVLGSLIKAGWDGAVWNVVLEKAKDKVEEIRLPDVQLSQSKDQMTGEQLCRLRKMRGLPAFAQYRRVTVKARDHMDLHAIAKNSSIAKMDVVAVQPETDEMLAKCCESAQTDLITLDFSLRGNWSSLTFRNVGKAMKRGLFFEVTAGAVFKRGNSADRSSFFSNVRKLVQVCRGKQIVMSLGATDWQEVRGPQVRREKREERREKREERRREKKREEERRKREIVSV